MNCFFLLEVTSAVTAEVRVKLPCLWMNGCASCGSWQGVQQRAPTSATVHPPWQWRTPHARGLWRCNLVLLHWALSNQASKNSINSQFQAGLFWRRLGNFNLQTNSLYFSQVVWTLNLAKKNDLDLIWQDYVKFALWESAGGILSLPFFLNYDIFISGTLPWGMRPAEAARFHLPLCSALWTASYSWCTGPLHDLRSPPSPSCSLNWQRFVLGPKYRDEKKLL